MKTPSLTILNLHRDGASSRMFGDTITLPAPAMPKYLQARSSIGLPEVSEIDVVRHYTKLSYDSHGVDNGPYPLGSCTMKYNPKRNDVLANLSGLRNAHPLQPESALQGLWELYARLQPMLCEITGMDACSLVPAAGAHGELAGLLIIRAYFSHKKDQRKIVLIPDSAHGTNPASASMAGFECRIVPTDTRGRVDMVALRGMITPDVAAFMLTNPSTLGLFEDQIVEIASLIHTNGSLLYYDGANLNALMGIVRPGDMGFDVVHVNLHKTFSTPHGGGGPGAGPIAVKSMLEPFLPLPVVRRADGKACPDHNRPLSIGRVKNFHGHALVLVRAYAYVRSMGAAGLKAASEDAVLNANYMQHELKEYLPQVYPGPCKHEALLSGSRLKTSSSQFAKRLIDYDMHPPTLVGAGCVYFPGDLKSAMLIEPTETESKASLDHQIEIFKKVFNEDSDETAMVEQAPHSRKVARIEVTFHE